MGTAPYSIGTLFFAASLYGCAPKEPQSISHDTIFAPPKAIPAPVASVAPKPKERFYTTKETLCTHCAQPPSNNWSMEFLMQPLVGKVELRGTDDSVWYVIVTRERPN